MFRIRRNDSVEVIAGKDRGKKGKVLRVFTKENRAIVEGINLMKKHRRKTREDQQGGIAEIEMPIALSNIMLFCKYCEEGVRTGITVLKDGTKTRICKACKEAI